VQGSINIANILYLLILEVVPVQTLEPRLGLDFLCVPEVTTPCIRVLPQELIYVSIFHYRHNEVLGVIGDVQLRGKEHLRVLYGLIESLLITRKEGCSSHDHLVSFSIV
jgi:hypothetical protein